MHEIVGDGELDALAAEIDGLRAELLTQAEQAARPPPSPQVLPLSSSYGSFAAWQWAMGQAREPWTCIGQRENLSCSTS